MTDELTWIKTELTKLLVDVAANGAPSTEHLSRSLGRIITGYEAPISVMEQLLAPDRLRNGG